MAALSSSLTNGERVKTADSSQAPLQIVLRQGTVQVKAANDEAQVVQANIKTCSGVIHKINRVLLPAK